MKNLTILVDLDSIVANLQNEWYKRYNKDWDDDLDPQDIREWDVHKFVKKECGTKMYEYLTPELFESLKPIPGAVEALTKLHWDEHDITFVTASPEHCADAKVAWVKKYFPMFTRKDIIIAHKKWMVKGDVFIDDSPDNLKAYHQHWPKAKLITIGYPYNYEVKDFVDLRAGDWNNLKEAWEEIVEFIESLEHDQR